MQASSAPVDTTLGRDVAVRLTGTPCDPRGLSRLVFDSAWAVRAQRPEASERAAQWADWSQPVREAWLGRLDGLLEATWPAGCSPQTLLATTHRHLGDLEGPLSLTRCRVKEDDPSYTKPMHAFWTCPVMAGDGPVGFEGLVRELHPHRRYDSWDVRMEPCDVVIVDGPQDWDRLVATTGAAPGHDSPTPRWDALPYDAVHCTNRAIIASYAPAATPLWDWGMEQTAWFAPRGTYERRNPTES